MNLHVEKGNITLFSCLNGELKPWVQNVDFVQFLGRLCTFSQSFCLTVKSIVSNKHQHVRDQGERDDPENGRNQQFAPKASIHH